MGNEKHLFCFNSLNKEGLTCIARFVLIFASISCALSITAFFQQPADGSQSRVIYFLIACYSALYCFVCRELVRGVEEERKDKILLWIGFTVVSIIFLIIGSVYEFTDCWSNFDELPTKTWMLIFAALFLLLAFLLMYFTWCAVLLWIDLRAKENQGPAV